jgi:hypothetical protein
MLAPILAVLIQKLPMWHLQQTQTRELIQKHFAVLDASIPFLFPNSNSPTLQLFRAAAPSPSKMHLLQPLVVVASLGSALASPLLVTGLEKAPARIEEAGKGGNINPNCPADRVKGIEKLVFEDCKSLNISKPLCSVHLLTRNPPSSAIEEFEKARNATLASKEQPCHLWHSDGCTKSLDKPWGCNFTPACHRQ